MRKVLILICLLISSNIANAVAWHELNNGVSLDLNSVKEKGNYIYLKYKVTDLSFLNEYSKNNKIGILIDESYVSYLTYSYIYDCKTPRYKIESTMIYGYDNKLLFKRHNNTWHRDLSNDEWAKTCSLKYYLKQGD